MTAAPPSAALADDIARLRAALAQAEVSDRPQRRTFSVADKLRILEEIERARPGDVGAILRREGLYSSNVGRWRRQRDAGQLHGLTPAKPGPKSAPAKFNDVDPQAWLADVLARIADLLPWNWKAMREQAKAA